jgi:phosphoglycerol transferase
MLGECLGVASAALAVAFVNFRLWAMSISVPLFPENDGVYYLMLTRMLGRENTYLHSAHLGYPYGFDLTDYAEGGDNAHWFALWLVQKLGLGPIAAVNLFYLATFALVAIGAYVALRAIGVSRLVGGALGVLYSFLPYHTARGANHLMLSQYALVPLGVVVALKLLDNQLVWRTRRFVAAAALMVGLASTGVYGLAFIGLLVAVAALFGSLNTRSRRPLAVGVALLAIGGTMFIVNTSPSLLARLRHGRNAEVANRSPFDTERFGLRPAQLVLPRTHHRIDAVAARAEGWRGDVVPSEDGQQLGIVGAVGLLVALGTLALGALGQRRGAVFDRVARLGLLAAVSIAVGAVSGVSLLLAMFGFREVRSWNRIVVVIGFCALATVGLAMDRFLTRHPSKSRGRTLGIVVIVTLVGLADQTSSFDTPNHKALAAKHGETGGFYEDLFARAPQSVPQCLGGRSGAIFTWPFRPFPEGGYFTYDAALGYVYQPDLQFGFGYMRGRHPDYAANFVRERPAEWIPELSRNFGVLVIDNAQADSAPPTSALATILGDPFASTERFSAYGLPCPTQ